MAALLKATHHVQFPGIVLIYELYKAILLGNGAPIYDYSSSISKRYVLRASSVLKSAGRDREVHA